MNILTLENTGETVTYKGNYKGWKHQKSEYSICLYRNNKCLQTIRTGRYKNATIINHIKSAFITTCEFKTIKKSRTLSLVKCKIEGFGGWHIVQIIVSDENTSYHFDTIEDCYLLATKKDKLESDIQKAYTELRSKIEKMKKLASETRETILRDASKKWNFERVRKKFGFCEHGMLIFINSVGLCSFSEYSSLEIVQAVERAKKSKEYAAINHGFLSEIDFFLKVLNKSIKQLAHFSSIA